MEGEINERKTFSRVGFGFVTFLLTAFVIQIFVVFAILRFKIKISFGSLYVIGVSLANYVVGGGITYLIVKDMPVICRPEEKKAGAGMLISGFLISMSAMFYGNVIGLTLMSIVSGVFGRSMINPVEEMIKGLNFWAIFLTMVIMAPVCEELLFRRVLINRIRQYGDKAAVLVSSVTFALCHGNFYQFFYAFGIGLVFGYIYIKTGKLRYTIIFHMIINFLGSVVALWVGNDLSLAGGYFIILLGMVIAGTVLFFVNKGKLVLQPGLKEIWGKGTFKSLFFNWGMIMFFIIAAITFVF